VLGLQRRGKGVGAGGGRGGGGGGGLGGSLGLGVSVTLGRFLACPQESSLTEKVFDESKLPSISVLKPHQPAAES